MVSNFTNVIARLINSGKRTVNSLDICLSWLTMDLFLYISLGTLMLARFSLQMFAHHFVNGNPLASTGPLHFVYFFFLALESRLFLWVRDWSNDPKEGKTCIPFVSFFLALESKLFILMSSGLIQWPKRRQKLHSFGVCGIIGNVSSAPLFIY